MNLFEKHSAKNENDAKSALVKVAERLVSKYIVLQRNLNTELSGGNGPQGGPCLACKVNAYTKRMAKLELQTSEVCKTYKLMFNEVLDIDFITSEATEKLYNLVKSKKNKDEKTKIKSEGKSGGRSSAEVFFPKNMPPEVKNAISKITDVLNKESNGSFNVKVFDMSSAKDLFGVNPKDYSNPMDFYKAVKAAAKIAGDTELGKPGEEIIKEAIIHDVEETVDSAISSSPSSNGTEKPKRTKDSGSKGTDKLN